MHNSIEANAISAKKKERTWQHALNIQESISLIKSNIDIYD